MGGEIAKQNVQLAFDEALNALDVAGREPDTWEQRCLVNALCSMAAGHYTEAAARIIEVTRSIQLNTWVRRRRAGGARGAEAPVTKDLLRRGLTYIRVHR